MAEDEPAKEKITEENVNDNEPSDILEIETPDSWRDVFERLEHPSHPIRVLCETCREQIRNLEIATFVLRFQPIFHYFTEEQLLKMEEYLTGENRETMKLPLPSTQNSEPQQRSGIPFLKNEHLTRVPQEAEIQGVKINPAGKYGVEINLRVAFVGGRAFIYTVRDTNPNYTILIEKLGDETDDWKGKRVCLSLTEDEFSGRIWPRISFPASAKAGK